MEALQMLILDLNKNSEDNAMRTICIEATMRLQREYTWMARSFDIESELGAYGKSVFQLGAYRMLLIAHDLVMKK